MKNLDKKKIGIVSILALVLIVGGVIYYLCFRTVTVTFTLKIGPGIKAQEIKVGEKVKEPEKPVAQDYEFVGWYLDDKLYDFNEPVKKDINLEAKWEAKKDK